MSKSYEFEYVKNYFLNQGCELLEEQYINSHTKMKYKCSCGNISEINFDRFQIGSRCKQCGIKKMKESKKHSYDYVYNYFKDNNCELLEKEYINDLQKLKYRCQCGNISEICFLSFKKGSRCKECGLKKRLEKRRFSYEYIYNFFQDRGCELLEKEYINNSTKMKYRCKCGNIDYVIFNNFKRIHSCHKCNYIKLAEKTKHSYEYVFNYFKEHGCKLLETEYKNDATKMRYICECDNEGFSTFNGFKSGNRCGKCLDSKGVKKIVQYLSDNNIMFEREYRFVDCKNKKPLPFDFVIFDNDTIFAIIEFDGLQHIQPIAYYGGEDMFKIRQQNDQIKNNYCLQNNIPLLRIPYIEFDNIEQILDNFLSNFNQINIKQQDKQDNVINF
jgi:hypothetical protein